MDKRAQIVTKLHILQAKSCRISEFVYLNRPSCDHICHGQNLVKFPKNSGHQSIFIAIDFTMLFQDSQDRMNDRGPLNATWPWQPWHGQVALRKRRAKQLETAPRHKRSHWNSMSQGLESAQLMALRCLNKWYACEIGYPTWGVIFGLPRIRIKLSVFVRCLKICGHHVPVWFVFNQSVLGTSWDVELHWSDTFLPRNAQKEIGFRQLHVTKKKNWIGNFYTRNIINLVWKGFVMVK